MITISALLLPLLDDHSLQAARILTVSFPAALKDALIDEDGFHVLKGYSCDLGRAGDGDPFVLVHADRDDQALLGAVHEEHADGFADQLGPVIVIPFFDETIDLFAHFRRNCN